jgi:hypothetical protein
MVSLACEGMEMREQAAASGARVHIKPIQTPVEKDSRILQICVSRPSECVCLINSRTRRNKYGRAPFHFYCPLRAFPRRD